MALTTQEEAQVRLLLAAMDGSKTIGDMDDANLEALHTAIIEVIQDGVSKKMTVDAIAASVEIAGELALKENLSNKVTSIDGASTDIQYPSAKVVYNKLAEKENLSNKLTSATGINSAATDLQYPSARAVFNALTEVITNFVTSTPEGAREDIAELEADFPTGATGIWIVKDTGHWYFYAAENWIDGGLYQSPLAVVQTTGTSETDVMSQKAVTDELNNIREKANNLYKAENRIDDYYVNEDTGQISALVGLSYFRLDVIGSAYYFMENDLPVSNQTGAWFNSDGIYITSLRTVDRWINNETGKRITMRAPSNAAYALINIIQTNEITTPIRVFNTPEQLSDLFALRNQVNKDDSIFVRYPLTDIYREFAYGIILNNGSIYDNVSYGHTPAIPVREGEIMTVTNYYGVNPPAAIYRGLFLDANFKLLSSLPEINSIAPNYEVPAGACYAVLNYAATEANNISVKITPQAETPYKLRRECIYPPEESSAYSGKKWVSFGDSITFREMWQPYIVAKFGLVHANLGIGSTCMINAGSAPMCSTDRLNAVIAENPDIVTILAGANDIVYSEGGTLSVSGAGIGDATEFPKALGSKNLLKFYGAYSFVIETLLTWKPTLRIFILGTTWAEADGTVSNSLLTYTDFSNASKTIAQYYGLPFIDLHGESGFNKFTLGASPLNSYSDDYIHPNTAGGKRMAEIIIGTMSRIIPI